MVQLRKLVYGIGYGLLAYVMGVGITAVLAAGRITQFLRGTGISPGAVLGRANRTPEAWQLIGWVFYTEHFFQIKVEAVGRIETFSLQELPIWNPILFVIPVISILLFGFISVYRDSNKDGSTIVLRSLGFATGYTVLGLVGIFLSTFSMIGVLVYPDTGDLPILIGYALILSVVGGGIASLTGTKSNSAVDS